MTTSNHSQADFTAEDQILELTEGQLEVVEGGGSGSGNDTTCRYFSIDYWPFGSWKECTQS
jgi:hypothetical protein